MAKIRDLSDFLDELDKIGELNRVKEEVHWILDMAAACANLSFSRSF